MAKGHFIRLGDETTCGGKVLEADTRVMMFGIAHAREGDRVSCGKNDETYTIVGGVSYINSHGRIVAGSLDSYSTCPCRARLIPSVFTATYESRSSAAPNTTRAAPQPTTPLASNPAPRSAGFAPASSTPTPVPLGSAAAQEPGFYIVPKSTTREQLEASLFTLRDPAVMGKFKLLNPNLRDVKAGSMIVLSDPNNSSCTFQEAQLMQAAQQVKAALDPLTPEEAEFMFRHGAEIASFTGDTSTVLGVSAAVMEKHLTRLRDTLQDIERLHQETYRQHGNLRSKSFFAERQRLLAQLDAHLLNSTLLRGQTTLGDHPKLKTALGISSRSLVHQWDKAGAPGQIPGYATHVSAISRAAKYMSSGGYIGIGIGGVSSLLAIQEVCIGNSGTACEKIKFTEGGKFAGSTFGGIAGGASLLWKGRPVCLALGRRHLVAGVGCTAALVGIGAWVGAEDGGRGGEYVGEKIFEAQQP